MPAALVYNQSYAESFEYTSNGGRRLATTFDTITASFLPLRTVSRFPVALDAAGTGMNAFKVTFLTDLVKDVADEWARLLAVNRVSGNLFAARGCTIFYETTPPKCAQWTADAQCGYSTGADDADVKIVFTDDLYGQETYYPNNPDTPVTAPAGTGVAGADFVMFVTAKHVPGNGCPAQQGGGGTQAYALTCQRDQNDRPTFGRVNFCPWALPVDAASAEAAYMQLFGLAMHEYAHSLGFSSASWPLFRNWDASPVGTPKTPRTATEYGLPPSTALTYTCGGQSNGGYESSVDTVEYFAERGLSKCTTAEAGPDASKCVHKHVGLKSIAAAREHFACADLNGAELENHMTTACSLQGSHWEQRIFNPELMTSYPQHYPILSAVTLATFEDSGWYKATYDGAVKMPSKWQKGLDWGFKQGCAFAKDKCIDKETKLSTGTPAHFVTAASSASACSLDRRGYGSAGGSFSTTANPPAAYQYFNAAETGGNSWIDFCPFVAPFSNRICSSAANQPDSAWQFGESFGASTACFEATLLRKDYVGTGPGAQCMEHKCTGSAAGAYTLTLTAVTTANVNGYPVRVDFVCTSADKGVSKTSVHYNGAVTCPNVDDFCTPAVALLPSYYAVAPPPPSPTPKASTPGSDATASPTPTSSVTPSPSPSPSSIPAVVSATLLVQGLTKADIDAKGAELKEAFKGGLATLLGVPADRVTVKAIYIATSRLLSEEAAVHGRSLAPGDVAVDFAVATTAGTASTALSSALTTALSTSTAASQTMLSTVAAAVPGLQGTLTVTVTTPTIVNVVSPPSTPAGGDNTGQSTLIAGVAAGAGVLVVLLLVAGLWKAGYLCGSGASSSKVVPMPAHGHASSGSTAV